MICTYTQSAMTLKVPIDHSFEMNLKNVWKSLANIGRVEKFLKVVTINGREKNFKN